MSLSFPVKSLTRLGVHVAIVLSGFATAHAETRVVDSIAALQSQINQAAPGDVILVKNGSYATAAAIAVRSRGAIGAPITIAAETVGGVEISGANGFNLTAPAAHVVISGFVFTHASGKNRSEEHTSELQSH